MLKILQARLQQYGNCELPDAQAGFRKGRGTRNQIDSICWIIKKARVPEKHIVQESWTIKKAECWRIDALELLCWRRLLRVPWTARRSNLSILKEISPEYSLEGLMLKINSNTLATWCDELTHWQRPWCWERWKAGKGDDRGQDCWMTSPTQWTWVWVISVSWWWTGKPGVLQSMGLQSQTWLSDWTELKVGHSFSSKEQV